MWRLLCTGRLRALQLRVCRLPTALALPRAAAAGFRRCARAPGGGVGEVGWDTRGGTGEEGTRGDADASF